MLILAEGDVEGVMDRPVGNTADVYMECEKWYSFRVPSIQALQR